MKALTLSLLLLTCVGVSLANAGPFGHFNGYTVLSQSSGTLTATTDVGYIFDIIICTGGCGYSLQGDHRIRWSRTGEIVAQMQWGTPSLHYRSRLYGSAAQGECYYATQTGVLYLTAYGTGPYFPQPPGLPYFIDSDGPWQSSTVCRPVIAPGDPCDINPFGPTCPEDPYCPLVINTGNGPWQLTGADDTVLFDIDADGRKERITWTAGRSLAFVGLDVNANGVIDDGSELFGIATLLPDGSRAVNGFEALRPHDRNHDGLIDDADPIWPRLLLWTDANHDASTDAGELTPLMSSEISALEVDYRPDNRRDAYGNRLRYRSQVHTKRGTSEPYYDVFFQAVP